MAPQTQKIPTLSGIASRWRGPCSLVVGACQPAALSISTSKLDQLHAYAQARGHSMGGMALAWLPGHPSIPAPIVGSSRIEHFAPIEEALRIKLSNEERRDLDTLFALTS